MHRVKPLPDYLLNRYHTWKDTTFLENREWFRKLAEEGQSPRAMVIACCDSRLEIDSIFGQRTGELFVHRNIANLVPPYDSGEKNQATGAAVEYAVKHLKVEHILVMGHSKCGGVAGCIAMCKGQAPEFDQDDSFIGRWLDVMRPGFEEVADIEDEGERQTALEKEGVRVSLRNLMGYPFVKEAIEAEKLSLHGLWTDITNMDLETLDGGIHRFTPV